MESVENIIGKVRTNINNGGKDQRQKLTYAEVVKGNRNKHESRQ